MGRGIIAYTNEGLKLLARLMRAEAVEDGAIGMMCVGTVGVNRVLADCYNFEEVTNIREMVFQQPGGFEAVHYSFFWQKPREKEKKLARKVLHGQRTRPATYSLYFYAPPPNTGCRPQWFGAWNAGRYKSHCFYQPTQSECPHLWSF